MNLPSYTQIPIIDNGEPIVLLNANDFILEPVYYTQGISPTPDIYARLGIREKLLSIQNSFHGKYRIKIWDIFRPRDVQKKIYERFLQELMTNHPDWSENMIYYELHKFVSPPNPEITPPHITGGAVDITFVDEFGYDLDMGSSFDSFTPEDAPYFYDIYARNNTQIIENREILREAMLHAGFTLDADEWWHFDYGNQIWAQKMGNSHAIYGELRI